ncbi:MAG TPA: accessory factor UbiK family protein [Burkholderiaceae bacterium]|nr:accessory factor UbiK family protein [Burkholderiaceae bacterium]
MVNRNEWVEDFQKNISELIARSPAGDIERNIKAFMSQAFSRMDLVTREEFDIQAQLLERAIQRITALESRLDQLEGRHSPVARAAAPMGEAVPPVEPAATDPGLPRDLN